MSIKNVKKFLLTALILSVSMTGAAHAEETETTEPPAIVEEEAPAVPEPVTIHLTIATNTESIYDQDIAVDACNSDNGETSDLKITAYCAILQSGIQNEWNWDWAPGAFLNSLGDIAGFTTKDKDNNDVYHYWSWSLNNTEGTTGLNQYELQPNDLISLNFIDPVEPAPELPPENNEQSGGGGGGGGSRRNRNEGRVLGESTKAVFDIEKAFEFIIAQQKENGSFGADIYTDWTALALATGNYQEQVIKLIKYLGELKMENPRLPDGQARLTDYERRAMALMSLGLNPWGWNGENYIGKITSSFDGKQFGDVNEDNDDIFALIVLQNAGYGENEKMISDDIAFVLGRQRENSSWDESVDMTGASMEALSVFSPDEQVKNALGKAKKFLKEKQKDNGGWNDSASSTAWALQGILASGEKPEDWIKKGPAKGGASNTPLDYLATLQDADGSIKGENLENKIWETAYVLSALSGRTWNQIMQKFDKQTKPAVPAETSKKPAPKQKIPEPKPENTEKQDATIVTSAITPPPTDIEPEIPKKNWFRRLLENIFNIF
ncbi:MAG: hypothetical protein UW07_C0040G0010 [Candidatus Nomurabacteria bacterium GW2011_GWF2_43_8]|uniref:DUF4430 domain-containing protein n=1 Tax=Candidatus Nomurabacteria bacterium GW2011_GWF2_43_8 TaxID=1618779 RepID=A0A0G1FIP4_9BACT|nr:MAG: hypothetical protein UW07_C0040G0010 [Candidatus Nomurabacteria bacterium GW2011_GWF2_43_8]